MLGALLMSSVFLLWALSRSLDLPFTVSYIN